MVLRIKNGNFRNILKSQHSIHSVESISKLQNYQQCRCLSDSDKTNLVRCASVTAIKSPLVIETKERRKTLKQNEVRIKVHCCAVNSSDYLIWTGLSETKIKLPFVPGFEISGEISEIDNSKQSHPNDDSDDEDELSIGNRVIALNKENLNGFSDECIVDKKDVFRIGSGISYEVGAALADSYGTALLGISRRSKVQQKETVLITAAAGGLGLAAVDLAANVYKAKVIGVCGTEDKASLVREKGAWAAFTYKNAKTLQDEVSKISEGKGADVVFDAVGGEVFKSALHCVAPEGKVIVAGFGSREVPNLAMSDLLQLPSFSLIGVSLSNYRLNMFKVYRRAILDAIELCEQGLITPHISETHPLQNVDEALSHLEFKKSTGKVILKIRSP